MAPYMTVDNFLSPPLTVSRDFCRTPRKRLVTRYGRSPDLGLVTLAPPSRIKHSVGLWRGLFPYSYGGSHGFEPCSLLSNNAPQLLKD